jgi:hypothetical protein
MARHRYTSKTPQHAHPHMALRSFTMPKIEYVDIPPMNRKWRPRDEPELRSAHRAGTASGAFAGCGWASQARFI